MTNWTSKLFQTDENGFAELKPEVAFVLIVSVILLLGVVSVWAG